MAVNVNHTYCGDYFTICTNIELLCHTPEMILMLYVYYIYIFNYKNQSLYLIPSNNCLCLCPLWTPWESRFSLKLSLYSQYWVQSMAQVSTSCLFVHSFIHSFIQQMFTHLILYVRQVSEIWLWTKPDTALLSCRLQPSGEAGINQRIPLMKI